MTINDFELEFGVNDFEFEIDTSTQTQVNEQVNEFQVKTKQEEMEEELKKNIDNLPKYATEALNALDEKEKIDKAMDEKIEILSEIRTPHEKRNFIEERINEAKSDENIKEALNALDEKEKIDKAMDALQKRHEQEKENLKKEFENKDGKDKQTQDSDNSKEKEKTEENSNAKNNNQGQQSTPKDEDYERALKEIEDRHAKELEDLQKRQDKNIDDFTKAINNLANATSIAKLLESLKEMDKALALIITNNKELVSLTDEQRLEKLELALKQNNSKEAVEELIKDLHKNIKTAQKGLDELELEKQNYVKLDRLNQKANKDPREVENLKKFMEKLDKETPNFKEHYPKTYEKSQKIIEKHKNQEHTKEKSQGMQR
ncbi:hypothetical protein CVIC8964_0650 [Campylobacter vicugnae]|uniref:Uncharacterized protein n=1 Tax=Campylobacter vicugnae TaxID=1660076 RepID=A0A1X9T0Q9_9BACT|nr:hypothetical protein [Campylobacter sp. RM8964]ARR02065.1 hypothetical protein CVIC8964_0650 [Campylobacter sp. RM8964]